MRVTRVTTKTGDRGETRLGTGKKVGKENLRIRCLGGLDELNSNLGLAISATDAVGIITELQAVQNDLMNINGELSLPDDPPELLGRNRIGVLENRIRELNAALPELKEFILPGGNEFTARLHVTRSVCRRIECDLVELSRSESIGRHVLAYLNRLSDYLFVYARYFNREAGANESMWEHPR